MSVSTLRYNGTLKTADRIQVKEEFAKAEPGIPLLITAGAGKSTRFLRVTSITNSDCRRYGH